MFIEHLEARNFRNLDYLSLRLSPHRVQIVGSNAQGKTNLLEALYVCATGRSFRKASSADLLKHETQSGIIRATLIRQNVRHEVEVVLTPKRRGVRVDNRVVKLASKLLELINVVAFFPDDLRIAKGSPEERRRFLDRSVANYEPSFVEAAIAYAKTLKSRNALLKSSGRPDPLLLETYDDQLITHGSIIHASRVELLEELRPIARTQFELIMEAGTRGHFQLKSGVSGADAISGDNFKDTFRQALLDNRERDTRTSRTNVGPHRADLLMEVDGRDARQFASQGQQRALVLSLKLAEVIRLKQRLGCPPILLLDDVSSELDTERTRLLFDVIDEVAGQVWVSSTGAAALPLSAKTQVLSIKNGQISPAAEPPSSI